MLLEVMKYSAALQQYQAVLMGSPNRLNALLGAAIAAKKSAQVNLANDYKGTIRSQTKYGTRNIVLF